MLYILYTYHYVPVYRVELVCNFGCSPGNIQMFLVVNESERESYRRIWKPEVRCLTLPLQ